MANHKLQLALVAIITSLLELLKVSRPELSEQAKNAAVCVQRDDMFGARKLVAYIGNRLVNKAGETEGEALDVCHQLNEKFSAVLGMEPEPIVAAAPGEPSTATSEGDKKSASERGLAALNRMDAQTGAGDKTPFLLPPDLDEMKFTGLVDFAKSHGITIPDNVKSKDGVRQLIRDEMQARAGAAVAQAELNIDQLDEAGLRDLAEKMELPIPENATADDIKKLIEDATGLEDEDESGEPSTATSEGDKK